MKTTTLLAISLLVPSLCFSESIFDSPFNNKNNGRAYDSETGNSYRWNTDYLGNTRVQGNNYSTGSNWNTTIEKDGDMRGTDSNGNSWNYNDRSGTYMNYGTGEIRTKRNTGW